MKRNLFTIKQKGENYEKWIFNISILIVGLIVIGCIFRAIIGSLEMFPTEEQMEKIRLVYLIMATIFSIIDIVLIGVRVKIGKEKKYLIEY